MNYRFVRARRRSRSTPEQRAQWVRQYSRSGLSQREFANRHQLGLSTLRKWIAQKPAGASSDSEDSPDWKELKLPVGLGPRHWAAELVRPDGWSVRVAPETPPAWVGELLRAGAC
jgi:transposase-like protein